MRAGTLAILLVQVSCQILKQAGWLIRTALLNAMLLKQTFPLGILVLLMVGLGDRLRMLLVICRKALYTEVNYYIAGAKLNISNLRIDLRLGIRQFGERHMVKTLALV
jgi:hypothetical protein